MGWRRPLQACWEGAGSEHAWCVPRRLELPLCSPFSSPAPSLLPQPPTTSHPRRRSASVGTRERQQRLRVQVTTPLSLLNGWVAKTAHSNRAASPSARCPALPARRPSLPTAPCDLLRWPEPGVWGTKLCQLTVPTAVLPKVHRAAGCAGVSRMEKLRLRGRMRKAAQGTWARIPTQGLTSACSQPPPYLGGAGVPHPDSLQTQTKGCTFRPGF